MEIITATESVALNLKYHNKEAHAKSFYGNIFIYYFANPKLYSI